MSTAQPGKGPDLTGLQSSYTTSLSRTMRWVTFVAFGLIAFSAIGRLLSHPDGWDIGLSII